MLEHEDLVREVANEPRRVGELAREDHEVEDETMLCKRAQTCTPCRVAHEVASVGEASGGIFGPAQDVPYADNPRNGCLRLDASDRVRARQRDARDVARRHSTDLVNAFEPTCLAKRVM